ncbi:ABC transporter ATP-binding protein [bacterium]|nr:ABC transporter ATP-binding protein [bacterium]
MDINLNNISKSYIEGEVRHSILSDLTIKFPSKRFSVILGKSGSGKSTVLNLIGGIDIPDSGIVSIGSSSITTMSDKERTLFRRKNIGFIFQFFNLIPTLTVLENVCLISELDNKPEKETKEKALSILEQVGLADRRNSMPDRLSGGEQQRVAFARALTHDPQVILADEPTGNLDTRTGLKALELLSDLIRNHGKTLVMATHATEARDFADSIYQIMDKKLELVSD